MTVALALSGAAQAAGYNPVTQEAQSVLAKRGFDPGTLDGIAGGNTRKAILAFQTQSGLPAPGTLDSATLEKLGIGTAADKVGAVADWTPAPTQEELDRLVEKQGDDPSSPYSDYRPGAPAANLDLPGRRDIGGDERKRVYLFGSRRAGEPKHTDQGYNYLTGCLKTGFAPTDWSDLTIHYYCQMSKPRACYTYALVGEI